MKNIHWVASGLFCLLVLSGCDRFKTPTPEHCRLAVSNLLTVSVESVVEKEFGSSSGEPGEVLAVEMVKGLGTAVLTELAMDDRKVAWCEVNMSVHDANCVRVAQNAEEAKDCGFYMDLEQGLKKQ